jgi:hypothetical protein
VCCFNDANFRNNEKLLCLTGNPYLYAVQVMQLENQKSYSTLAIRILLWDRWNWILKETEKYKSEYRKLYFLEKAQN